MYILDSKNSVCHLKKADWRHLDVKEKLCLCIALWLHRHQMVTVFLVFGLPTFPSTSLVVAFILDISHFAGFQAPERKCKLVTDTIVMKRQLWMIVEENKMPSFLKTQHGLWLCYSLISWWKFGLYIVNLMFIGDGLAARTSQFWVRKNMAALSQTNYI